MFNKIIFRFYLFVCFLCSIYVCSYACEISENNTGTVSTAYLVVATKDANKVIKLLKGNNNQNESNTSSLIEKIKNGEITIEKETTLEPMLNNRGICKKIAKYFLLGLVPIVGIGIICKLVRDFVSPCEVNCSEDACQSEIANQLNNYNHWLSYIYSNSSPQFDTACRDILCSRYPRFTNIKLFFNCTNKG